MKTRTKFFAKSNLTVFTPLLVAMLSPFQAFAMEAVTHTAQEIDDVLITSPGISFGGFGYVNGEPSFPGRVEWHQAWYGANHYVVGTIHLENTDGSCVRVRSTAFDENGVEIGVPKDSGVECAAGNERQSFPVNIFGQTGAREVKVLLQSQAVNGTWSTIGSQVVTYGPYIGNTAVSISAPEFDFGAGAFRGGTATESATVAWRLKSGTSIVEPVVTGTLYMRRADDLCGRMYYEYFDINNYLVDERPGITHCVNNDQLHEFALNADDFNGNQSVHELTISIQRSLNDNGASTGNWTTVGSTTTILPSVSVPVFTSPPIILSPFPLP
ncbi:MAG: hypothetical protein GXP08_03745 [Gammaproteobacteria bacterium]|nr:hypothetical protein [Gammaproteobacteria bacterium]